MKSSLLVVGHPEPATTSLGAVHISDVKDALEHIKSEKFAVIALSSQHVDRDWLKTLFDCASRSHPQVQKILINHGLLPSQLQDLVNHVGLFRILHSFDNPLFERTLHEALEEYTLVEQNDQLVHLINDQNEHLKRLTLDLEQRIEKRQTYLSNARAKLLDSNDRVEALHRTLIAIHEAENVSELESLIHAAMSSAVSLSWIRILFKSQSILPDKSALKDPTFDIFSTPLVCGRDQIGEIYFAREKHRPFRRDEHSFLIQVAEAVALAIDRLTRLDEAQTLKHQWEATFDAISSPLSLIDKNYTVLRCNRAYAQMAHRPIAEVIGRPCFQSLFQRDTPCPSCHLNDTFQLPPRQLKNGHNVTLNVISQTLNFSTAESPIYVMIYRDMSKQQKLEKQLLESAKMAELGTISSSIAHELNNPLGGIISFLQLMKTELNGDELFYDDISAMEKGAQHCKEIVQNLLHFSRRPQVNQTESVDLREVLQSSIKITELQTLSKGIQLHFSWPDQPFFVEGQFNLLTQAFRHILQLIHQAITVELQHKPGQSASIQVELEEKNQDYTVHMTPSLQLNDVCREEFERSKTQDLPLTEQILKEHNAHMEFITTNDKNFLVQMTFERLENHSKPIL